MGRDSPGGLLFMLAEVASQTCDEGKKQNEVTSNSRSKVKPEILKKNTQDMSLNHLLSMTPTHLVKQFTIYNSDELKRQYSYTCKLLPDCGQKYTSFASEIKARASIKSHLIEHLEFMKDNPDMCKFQICASNCSPYFLFI